MKNKQSSLSTSEEELLYLRADTRVEVLQYDDGAIVDRQTFDLSFEYY